MLAQIDPFLRDLNPFIDWLGLYKHELTAFFANSTAATQATFPLDASNPTGARAALPAHDQPGQPGEPRRLPEQDRQQPLEPLHRSRSATTSCATGLQVFGSYLCTSIRCRRSSTRTDPNNPGVGPPTTLLAPSTFDLIQEFIYDRTARRANCRPRPASAQAPLGNLLGQTGVYPHVNRRRIP